MGDDGCRGGCVQEAWTQEHFKGHRLLSAFVHTQQMIWWPNLLRQFPNEQALHYRTIAYYMYTVCSGVCWWMCLHTTLLLVLCVRLVWIPLHT